MDTAEDTGRDTAVQQPIVSAAELAGEKGGISCNTTPTTFLLLLIVVVTTIIATRIRRK